MLLNLYWSLNFILDVKVNVLAEKDEVDGKYSLEEKTISSKLIL